MVPYLETNLKSLNGRRILTAGLPTVKIVNKIQLSLILYFELFDLENFRLGIQKLHLTPPPFLTTIDEEIVDKRSILVWWYKYTQVQKDTDGDIRQDFRLHF